VQGALAQLEWLLWWGEKSGRQWDKGRDGNIGVIMMIFLILASSLLVALLLAILAVARQPTNLLLLLLLLLLTLLLVELGIFPLVLNYGDAVGIFSAASIAATKAVLLL
jgi:cytochrome bd-type quinol oxidase subunit 2